MGIAENCGVWWAYQYYSLLFFFGFVWFFKVSFVPRMLKQR